MVVSVTLCPGATVNDAAGETENAAGVPSHREIPVTSSAPFPVFRTCVVREAVLPTVTVPKSSAAGSTAIEGTASAAAVPLTARLTSGLAGSLLASARQPESVPAAVGR